MTAASQNYARKTGTAIDLIAMDYEMLNDYDKKDPMFKESPADGVYCYGLFLDGACFCRETKLIAEQKPKVLHDLMPVMWVLPKKKVDVKMEQDDWSLAMDTYPYYWCPAYLTAERKGILRTTGHSSNYVCPIFLPSDKPQSHWIMRGVALLSQLSD